MKKGKKNERKKRKLHVGGWWEKGEGELMDFKGERRKTRKTGKSEEKCSWVMGWLDHNWIVRSHCTPLNFLGKFTSLILLDNGNSMHLCVGTRKSCRVQKTATGLNFALSYTPCHSIGFI